MELEVSGTVMSRNATEAEVITALRAIAPDIGNFAILTRADATFIQTAYWGYFALEYQDGSVDEHYQCIAPTLSVDAVIAAFLSYLRGDGRWRTEYVWERMTL